MLCDLFPSFSSNSLLQTLKMDDEIDIEEHDILEHPLVKAVFPDLSKLQIQVHASGASFLNETLVHSEEFDNLPEEAQAYLDNDFEDGIPEDLLKTAQEEHELLVPFLEECSEEDISENKDFVEEAHVISDSEYIDDAVPVIPPINGNVDSSVVIRLDNRVDVLDISEDELIDAQYHAASKLVDETDKEIEIATSINKHSGVHIGGCNIVLRTSVEDIYEISDEEIQSQELEVKIDEIAPKNVDVLTKKTLNGDEFMEIPINGDELKSDLDGDGLIEDGLKNCEFIEEGLELFNEDQVDEIEELNHNVDEKHSDAVDQDEFQPIRIKEEVDYVDSMTSFDETLVESFNEDIPPEDIYHFNNKIILGSRPSPQGKDSNHAKSYLVVLLEDWKVHLTRSQSYCNICQTLFTTPNALDSHRMSTHSLLAPITNRAVKSTAKSSLTVTRSNIAKKSTAGQDISNSTYCNHCNVTFKDHTTLIKHLYKLLPAKQYCCNICQATFQSQNDLVNHNSIHVKVEPRKILKAKNNSESNSILKKLLNNGMKAMNNKPLKRSHPVEKLNTVKMKKEVVFDKWWTSRFKCLICDVILETYTIARKHRRVDHPEVLALEKMFHRLPSKNQHNSKDKNVDDISSTESAKDIKEEKLFDLIPKSALFQCSKCSFHFTSSVAGASHFSGNRCSDGVCWSCPICKKKFRKRDQLCHTKQHKLSSKFKVYKITKNTYERTLCKCLKCGVHFEYILLKAHIAKCGKIPTAKCQQCNIMISKYKLDDHTKRHDVMKLKPKDFVLVDYAVINDKSKSKTIAHKKTTDKTNKKDDSLNLSHIKQQANTTDISLQSKTVTKLKFEQEKVKLYYCKRCKSFLSRRAKSHFTKQCVGKSWYKFTWNCTLCGLQLFLKYRNSHKRLHVDNNFTLKDIEFLDLATLKPIKPPIPKYPSCRKCKIHFIDAKMINDHICGEDYENCEVCGDKFENSTLDLHLPFHELHAERPPIPNPRMIPELMMKYESLNAIWNILFICGKCNVVTDLYNKAVEHSQTHLKKENAQQNTIKCYICNLKFDESCWSKHSDLHSRMSINNKDFKILEYTPKNLLDESWFQMFESLPEKEIRQIIDRSVFGSERSVKMKLVKDGLPEFTLYCCSVCQVSYDNSDILSHVNDKCRVTKHSCGECEVVFDTRSTLDLHELLHGKGIKKEEFRIVNFVKDTPKKANVKDTVTVKTKNIAKSKNPALKVKKVNGVSKFVLYKCVKCSACLLISHSRGYHNCAPAHHLVYCKICKQNFSFRQMNIHRKKHRTQHDFKAKNMKIVNFEPIPDGEDKPVKVRYITRAREIGPASSKSKRSLESTVDLMTSDNLKPKTRKTINSSKRSVSLDSSVTENRVSKVYKCDCGLHYTSLKTIEKHIGVCDNSDDISKEYCSKCGLLFPTDVLVSHLCKHHSANTKVTVEEVHKTSNVTEATSKENIKAVKDCIKLYKCGDCNVYFLNQNSCYKHTYRHELLDPKQYIECKMCRLQFRILSLHIHMKKHHEAKFNLEKVLVEEYHPCVGKEAPRIDIYYASDRFQNVQVSSSND